MVGVGNVGQHLSDFTSGDMFLSTDAGRTWKEVLKEAHMFEISDHGGIILMVNDEEAVTSVSFSLDMGTTFESLSLEPRLDGGKFRVQNIITEPSASTSHFVLFGRVRGGKQDSSIAIHLDFSNVWSKTCTFDQDATKSDFETWSPSNSTISNTCSFGAEVSLAFTIGFVLASES